MKCINIDLQELTQITYLYAHSHMGSSCLKRSRRPAFMFTPENYCPQSFVSWCSLHVYLRKNNRVYRLPGFKRWRRGAYLTEETVHINTHLLVYHLLNEVMWLCCKWHYTSLAKIQKRSTNDYNSTYVTAFKPMKR